MARNRTQRNPVTMKNKIRERWGKRPIEAIPKGSRPKELSHFQIEELYFLSSTGISFQEAQQALREKEAERQNRNPKASKHIPGGLIREVCREQRQLMKRRSPNIKKSNRVVSKLARKARPRQAQYQHPNRRGQRVVPAHLIRRAAFKTIAARLGTKVVLTSPNSRQNIAQHSESTADFENLVRILKSEGKGRGWFAAKDIPQGTQILAEKPLLMIESPYLSTRESAIREAFNELSEENKATYMDLLYVVTQPKEDSLVKIADANSFSWEAFVYSKRQGVFARTSLINHDCQPNAIFDVDPYTDIGQIRAKVNIPKGTEITIRYCEDEFWDPVSERKRKIREVWQFDCHCGTCNSAESEAVRANLRRLVSALIPEDTNSSHTDPELVIDRPGYKEEDPMPILKNALEYVNAMTGAGMTGIRMARAFNMAARLLQRVDSLQSVQKAGEYLYAAQRINEHCFGKESQHYYTQAEKIQKLEAKI